MILEPMITWARLMAMPRRVDCLQASRAALMLNVSLWQCALSVLPATRSTALQLIVKRVAQVTAVAVLDMPY